MSDPGTASHDRFGEPRNPPNYEPPSRSQGSMAWIVIVVVMIVMIPLALFATGLVAAFVWLMTDTAPIQKAMPEPMPEVRVIGVEGADDGDYKVDRIEEK